MPALSGQVVSTIRNGNSVPLIIVTMSYDPATNLMRDAVVATSTGDKTGALVVDNMTGRSVKVLVRDPDGTINRTFNIPPAGSTVTKAQLASQGVTTQQQLNGLTLDLS
jgi:hypothetical protein